MVNWQVICVGEATLTPVAVDITVVAFLNVTVAPGWKRFPARLVILTVVPLAAVAGVMEV
jgi:hypothetical protein